MQVCRRCGERNPDRARFCMACAEPLAASDAPQESRRVATVLFADLKGSTSIGERLDAEATRRVLTRFYDAAREVIERHGGTVEKFIGDAVMAVFGVPRVHEDDAFRGVRAAAELQQVLGRMNDELLRAKYGVGLELRIGVNTGEVVAGDPSTGSSFVAGDAVNVAARLEQAAPPGEVLLGRETWRAVRDAVQVEPTEPLELKGKAERVPAFRLIALVDRGGEATPFVGRTDEVVLLDRHLATAVAERRSVVVTIAGPQGIGKSQLVEHALARWGGDDGPLAVRMRCAPVGEGDPMGPIVGLVTGLLALEPGATADDVADAVLALMPDRERAPVIASTLAGLVRGRDRPSAADIAWSVAEVADGVAAGRALVLAVDDAHWADDDVRAVLEATERRATSALVVLRTVLPEFVGPAEHDVIEVPPLTEAESRSLLQALAGEVSGADEVVRRAEGNPLFLIETARMVRDRDELGAGEGSLGEVPTTIRGLIAARLEHLPVAEVRVLEMASTIGRVFALDAVASIGQVDAGEVAAAVDSLFARDLLQGVSGPHGRNASFAHALVREVAYAAMVKDRRADLHERYAAWMEARGRAVPSVVGHHLEQAYRLRCELGAPGPDEGRLAARAAVAFARTGLEAAGSGGRAPASDALARAADLTRGAEEAFGDRTPAVREARATAGELAFVLGDWQATTDLLDALAGDDDRDAAYRVGVALTQAHRGERDHPDLDRGRALLDRVRDREPRADVVASLAGSWKGIDDERALDLYREALDLDPGNPYALGNVIELEAASTGAMPPLAAMRSSFETAARRCRAQVDRGEDLPWACFDLAKFSLLAGEADEAFSAGCLGVARSTARFMIETSLNSLERFARLAPSLDGVDRLIGCYRLGLAGVFPGPGHEDGLDPSTTPDASSLAGPVIVVAGGSSREAADEIGRHTTSIVAAMTERSGTLISGGTRQGVSAIAGDVAEGVAGLRAVGYLPAIVPADVEVDDDVGRYAELRRTEGANFSVVEALRYWADVLASGVSPADVRLLAIGGGLISAAEYRLALALGASVGAIRGSGGAAAALLGDPWWAASSRLVDVSPETAALGDFLDAGRD